MEVALSLRVFEIDRVVGALAIVPLAPPSFLRVQPLHLVVIQDLLSGVEFVVLVIRWDLDFGKRIARVELRMRTTSYLHQRRMTEDTAQDGRRNSG